MSAACSDVSCLIVPVAALLFDSTLADVTQRGRDLETDLPLPPHPSAGLHPTTTQILDDTLKHSKLLKQIYAGVHQKPPDHPDLQAFFRFKMWA